MTKVALAIIEKDGKILIARRTSDDPLRGKWEFPGGKVEENETTVECLKREVEEELGVRIEAGPCLVTIRHGYPHTSVELNAYRAHIVSGQIQTGEYKDVTWAAPCEIERYDFPAANKPIIQAIKTLFREHQEKRP